MTEQERMSNHATRLSEAIAAARAGRREEAVRLLREITADDPFNVDAWVWLGGLASEPREQRAALEQALVVQPDHPRARQGLDWLRQRHPEVFDAPSTPAAATATDGARVYEASDQPAPVVTTPVTPEAPSGEVAPTYRAQAASAAAPTQPLPVFYQPAPTTEVAPTYRAQAAASTDRMAVAPPPPAPAVRARRSPGAELARALLALLWLAGLGAAATLAGLIFAYPQRFEPLVNSWLAPYNLQLVPALVPATRLGTAVALIALALLAALMGLGLLARGRWAWVLNLLVALLVTAGTAALLVTFVLLTPAFSTLLTTPGGRTLLGLVGFTFLYLILSLGSWRAFFRRSETTHER
ncbi:hypothetical protein [Kallotenue papyrolyticum]|uniref:hypothetical protein n=1 Tax=Kallotenue papyrolyticum TaxID=1325125 RepID=UPI0004922C2A|nr:hypothetical protein [Kallotenue papyrolyticum]